MSKQANPTVIGSFVLGALALTVAGILVLGGDQFFKDTHRVVAVFPGSVYGLDVGAPVSFRGVRIGSVVGILGVVDHESGQISVEVLVDVEQGTFKEVGLDSPIGDVPPEREIEWLVQNKGMRGKLALQSLVTGKLYVDVDFHPGTDITRRVTWDSPYYEMPTIESGMERLGRTIEALPVDQLATEALEVLRGIDRAVNAPEIRQILEGVNKIVSTTEQRLAEIDPHIEPLLTSLRTASDALRDAMVQLEQTLALESGVPGEIAAGLLKTTDAATSALKQAEDTLAMRQGESARLATSIREAADAARDAMIESKQTLADAGDFVASGSPLRTHLFVVIEELAAAARSIRILSEYLERHPEALIQGKP